MKTPEPLSPPDPKERLLECALKVFSDRGFQDASIRSICQFCDANVAAVNYYFGSKSALYRAVFEYGTGLLPEHRDLSAYPCIEEALGAYYHRLLGPLARGDKRVSSFLSLAYREHTEPSGELDAATKGRMLQPHQELIRFVAGVLKLEPQAELAQWVAMSVAVLALPVYRQAQGLPSLLPDGVSTPDKLQRTVSYLATTAAAILACHRPSAQKGGAA